MLSTHEDQLALEALWALCVSGGFEDSLAENLLRHRNGDVRAWTVRLLGDNLHFLAMNSSGSVYLTTVFSDRESRAGGKFKAVHTRHEFTEIRLTGYTSRPEQYYGYCEAAR